jgi:hypothetical protein
MSHNRLGLGGLLHEERSLPFLFQHLQNIGVKILLNIRFYVSTAVTIKNAIIWDMMMICGSWNKNVSEEHISIFRVKELSSLGLQ